ncbi:MAG: ribosome assembly cofactor RimP [Sphaerochaetaceae bacterium]
MIRNEIEKTALFLEYEPLLRAMGITLVDINELDHGQSVLVTIVIMVKDGEVNVDHCASVYRLVYPRMELQLGGKDLKLEVTTPGLQRTIKDIYEFSLFTGKRVRIYDTSKTVWISGIIKESNDDSLVLDTVFIEDEKEMIATMVVDFAEIKKAKLDYRWEDNSHGN